MEVGPFSVVNPVPERPARAAPAREAQKASFTDELGRAVQGLETVQISADAQAEALAQGNGNLHEAALALEKADVAMRLATKVRNKFVEAYQEIMRMNV